MRRIDRVHLGPVFISITSRAYHAHARWICIAKAAILYHFAHSVATLCIAKTTILYHFAHSNATLCMYTGPGSACTSKSNLYMLSRWGVEFRIQVSCLEKLSRSMLVEEYEYKAANDRKREHITLCEKYERWR